MRKYKVGDKVTLSKDSRFYDQCLDENKKPMHGVILEASHFMDFHWEINWYHMHMPKSYHYYEKDLAPVARNNEEALFFLCKDK